MNTVTTESMPDEKDKGIVFSLAVHVILVAFLILKNVFFDYDGVDYQSAIRIDLVALPDKDLSHPNPLAPDDVAKTADAIPETKPTPSEVETPKEALPEKKPVIDEAAIKLSKNQNADDPIKKKLEDKKKKEALDRIKKMSALESIKSSVETERIEKMVGLSETKAKAYKGNVLNPGTELTGINKIQHENYVALIDRQIKENWALPQWMTKKDFKAQALLKIDQNGTIVYNQIYKTSGNTNYDDAVLETIKKSGPFPKPPEKFSAILAEKGVLIGFPE